MDDVSYFVHPHLLKVRPYVPGKPIQEVQRELGLTGKIIKLASNEIATGPSPLAIDAIREELHNIHMHPEDSVFYLKKALSEHFDIPTEYIVVGNGSVELIHLISQAILGPGVEAIMGKPSFMIYEIMGQVHDSTNVMVHHPEFRNDLDGFGKRVTDRTRIIWIDNPNNPTGTYCSKKEVEGLIREVDGRGLVVLDEAYYSYIDVADFPDAISYVRKGLPVILLRSFSKTAGLAGIRCGFGFMDPKLVKIVDMLRPNFSVNSLAQAAGVAALKDADHFKKCRKMVLEGRKYFYENLDRIGVRYFKTQSNFVWIDFGFDAKVVYESLLQEGVIIRPGWIFGFPNFARVSVSIEEENEMFFKALEKVLPTFVNAR